MCVRESRRGAEDLLSIACFLTQDVTICITAGINIIISFSRFPFFSSIFSFVCLFFVQYNYLFVSLVVSLNAGF